MPLVSPVTRFTSTRKNLVDHGFGVVQHPAIEIAKNVDRFRGAQLHSRTGRRYEAFAMAGDVERATHWLGVAVDRGFANYPYISKHSPFFRALPETDALRSVKARIHERWASFQGAD